MKFRCEDFDGCIDKILDNSASEDVRSAFFLHLSECENCCREYENAKFIKETLRDRSSKLGENFTSSVMARISALPEKKKTVIPFNRVMRVAAPIAACLLIVFAVVFSAFSLEQRQKSLGEYISRDVPDEARMERPALVVQRLGQCPAPGQAGHGRLQPPLHRVAVVPDHRPAVCGPRNLAYGVVSHRHGGADFIFSDEMLHLANLCGSYLILKIARLLNTLSNYLLRLISISSVSV